jgi:hypothetical protein
MKMIIAGALLVLSLSFPADSRAAANDYAFAFSPRTGDMLLDDQLGEMNRYARSDTATFVEEIAVSFGVPRTLVREYYGDRRWAPGDIYYGCALAHQLGRPCREVLDIYERDHGQGWGVIAQRLGIKPGSPAFHALKGRVGKGHGKFKGNGGYAQPGTPPRPSNGPGNSGGKGQGQDQGKGKGPAQGQSQGQGQGKDSGKGKDKDKGGR